MDFRIKEEQKDLQAMAYKFAKKEFEPIAKECGREENIPGNYGKKPVILAWWVLSCPRSTAGPAEAG